MRTFLIATGVSSVLAAPQCVHPPLDKMKAAPEGAPPDMWLWQMPQGENVVPTGCYGRVKDDTYSPGECTSKCQALGSTAGITNAKTMCMNDATMYDTTNGLLKMVQDYGIIGSSAFAWTSMEKSGGVWSNQAGCTADVWPATGENANQLDWDGGGNPSTPVDAAVWVLGNDHASWPDDAALGSTPFLTGVTSGAPDPEDVFCLCQWDPLDPLACQATTYGCCDGTDVTMARVDLLGTNCVGGAGYVNSKEVSKAFDNAVAAAVGLGTGILVAVIVCPIVGLILLIICIVCICKHCCGNKKPAA